LPIRWGFQSKGAGKAPAGGGGSGLTPSVFRANVSLYNEKNQWCSILPTPVIGSGVGLDSPMPL